MQQIDTGPDAPVAVRLDGLLKGLNARLKPNDPTIQTVSSYSPDRRRLAFNRRYSAIPPLSYSLILSV
jgi:hypothetical protein